jgi:2-(1,2-epoxy-1,2-dihydrophenyl)acetyl-CoA isomerase
MSPDLLLFEQRGAVAVLTFNNPNKGNALDRRTSELLLNVVSRCDTDRSIRCVLLTGAGRMFCVGGDIDVFAAAGENASSEIGIAAGIVHLAVARLVRMRKPVITMVNGPAAGAGFSLAIVGDIVLAGRSAEFTAAYTAIGLTPDGGLTWLLPRLIGHRRAQDLILTNRRVNAEQAENIGLVTRVIDDASLRDEAFSLAAKLARGPTFAFGVARSLLVSSFETGIETQMELEARAISDASMSQDGREGVIAFLAKRSPNFKGT